MTLNTVGYIDETTLLLRDNFTHTYDLPEPLNKDIKITPN